MHIRPLFLPPPSLSTMLLAILVSPILLVHAGFVQKPGIVLPPSALTHRDAVKKIFTTSYEAYKQYAWGHDDLQPESKTYYDGRNGWGSTIVDAMPTLKIMGLDDWFSEAVNFSLGIDFSKSHTEDPVSVFETTIRFLGGLVSAYELSDGQYPGLLDKAKEVADKMSFAWADGHDVPYGHIHFANNTPIKDTSNIAEAGTLVIEWGSLSSHVQDEKYRQLAEKSFNRIASQNKPFPGLAVQGINPDDGTPVGAYVSWGGGSDSYFEYLIKYPRLTNTDDPFYVDEWSTAVDSTIKNLLRRSTVGDHLYTCTYDGVNNRFRHISSNLACFHGGNWILGGKLTNNETIVNYGLELADACWNTYTSTATGIGPEAFAYMSSDGNYTGFADPTQKDLDFYAQHGYYIPSGYNYYDLRPEVLESNFYAFRATGDEKYLERAASFVDSINKYLPGAVAFDAIWDVTNVNSDKIDDMESFWFAEVLKYLYLTFDDPTHISLDEYVFNTEAHPFKAPPSKPIYGSQTLHESKATFTASKGPALPVVSPGLKVKIKSEGAV
ncbi:glycoside hydrolase family 47 protein [Flagelloscypha sp. PMI_526]|nr:glycoside hydrolase family 47 protein [Flagelloscypha sp. PMI_526]